MEQTKRFNYTGINDSFDNCKRALDEAIVELSLIQPIITAARSRFVRQSAALRP